MPHIEALRRLCLPASALLLVACWLGGGVTEDGTSIDEWLMLASLPVLVLGAALLASDPPASRVVRGGLVMALLVAALPALQLLPLPGGLWSMPDARQALAVDLAAAGIDSPVLAWTLSPVATEASLWSLLPALAMFLAGIAMPARSRRRWLQVVVVVLLANIVFAFFQAGLPRNSPLRLYQDFNSGFGGLLANTNHQATACVIGMLLSVGLAVEARVRARRGEVGGRHSWWYAACAVFFLLAVPLSNSRAGLPIALVSICVVVVLAGVVRLSRFRQGKKELVLGLGLLGLVAIGLRLALGWVAVEQVDGVRHALAAAAVDIGYAHAPLGSGIGSFGLVFEQAAPPGLQLAYYVNHAHNEYAQWWLTAGWPGIAVLACAILLLAACTWRLARVSAKGGSAAIAGACLAAAWAVMLHSVVEYPLRTIALMATTSGLAGMMLAATADAVSKAGPQRGLREGANTPRSA